MVTSITNDEQYEEVLLRIGEIFDADLESKEGREREELVTLVVEYEDEYYPMGDYPQVPLNAN